MTSIGDVTSIPSAITQLYAIYSAAYPLDAYGNPVTTWFGKELGVYQTPATIEINGVSPANQSPGSMGPNYTREETFSIQCKVSVFATTEGLTAQDFLTNMNDTWNIWIALEKAVANNPTLNGVVRFAEFGEMTYEPTTDGSGRPLGSLTWVVRCSNRVTSLS